jgi:hypothetical protein
MGLESFEDNSINIREIEELAYQFVYDNIPYTKFKSDNKLEMELFLMTYKKALEEKYNGIEEKDPEVKLAA